MAVLGMPSSSCSRRIFFRAIMLPSSLSLACGQRIATTQCLVIPCFRLHQPESRQLQQETFSVYQQLQLSDLHTDNMGVRSRLATERWGRRLVAGFMCLMGKVRNRARLKGLTLQRQDPVFGNLTMYRWQPVKPSIRRTLYTTPYVPSPIFSTFSYCVIEQALSSHTVLRYHCSHTEYSIKHTQA